MDLFEMDIKLILEISLYTFVYMRMYVCLFKCFWTVTNYTRVM